MTPAVVVAFGFVLALVWVASIWGLICSTRAFQQRRSFLLMVSRLDVRGLALALLEDYRLVGYNRHLWALMRLRPPWALYPWRVQAFLRQEGVIHHLKR